MRLAVLSDVHGNWDSLRRVAEDLAALRVDAVFGLGDYLNTSIGAPKVVEWMKNQHNAYFVRGNGDSWEYYHWSRSFSAIDLWEEFSFVTKLPSRVILTIDGLTVSLQHGFPYPKEFRKSPTRDMITTIMTLEYIRSVVDLTGIDIACFGDLHRSCVLADNEIIAVFPGSVGAPLDEELCSGKYMVIEYDERQIRVFQRRVPFSGDAAINEMRQALLPGNEKFLWIERVLRGEKGSEWPAVIPPFVRKRRTKR